MKFLVFMSDNRPLSTDIITATYNSLVAAINYEYCKKYGYDFIYYQPFLNKELIELHNCIDPNSGKKRHASWSKLLSTSKALELDYDYVVYIDSDCIFKDFSRSIEEYMKNITEPIIFLNDRPWGTTYPCAGFFILQVNDYTRQFIKTWYNFNIPNHNTHHAYEQNVLYDMHKLYTIKIIDDMMFCEKKDQYLRHIGSHANNLRIVYFKKFIQDNTIDYLANIQQIQVIKFDTNT